MYNNDVKYCSCSSSVVYKLYCEYLEKIGNFMNLIKYRMSQTTAKKVLPALFQGI